jgi:hypothetical protein
VPATNAPTGVTLATFSAPNQMKMTPSDILNIARLTGRTSVATRCSSCEIAVHRRTVDSVGSFHDTSMIDLSLFGWLRCDEPAGGDSARKAVCSKPGFPAELWRE